MKQNNHHVFDQQLPTNYYTESFKNRIETRIM